MPGRLLRDSSAIFKESGTDKIAIHGGFGMRRGLILVCASGLSLAFATASFAKAKGKKHEPEWCCMVGGEVASAIGQGPKKMCVKSEAEPSETSKSGLAKKYAKACGVAKGTWQKGGETAAAAPAGNPMAKAKDALKGKAVEKMDEKVEEKGGTEMKETIEDATE
jgi:hypothetical protein